MKKIGSPGSFTVIILFFETCSVASKVNPRGVVVVKPDWRPGTVGSSPVRGMQPICLEEYVERKKEIRFLSLPHLYFFLHRPS